MAVAYAPAETETQVADEGGDFSSAASEKPTVGAGVVYGSKRQRTDRSSDRVITVRCRSWKTKCDKSK